MANKLRDRRSVKLVCPDPSRTKQSFKGECDINKIVNRYRKNGIISHTNNRRANYGDFTNFSDYQAALQAVSDVQTLFGSLPAIVRNKFENDPGKFLDFVHNPENTSEMVELGLLEKPAPVPGEAGNKPLETQPKKPTPPPEGPK